MNMDLFTKAALGPSAANLPAQVAALVSAMQQTASDIAEIRQALTVTAPSQPDAYAKWAPIASAWYTAEQAVLVGLLVTADTTDFYELLVGNGGSNIIFGLTAYVPTFIDLSGVKRIPVTRGTQIRVVQSTSGGTAVIKAAACYLPGDDWGAKGK